MGLEVYVGTLTRYYTGDWETVVQRVGREQGIEMHVVRPGQAGPAAPPDEVRQAVLIWRDAVSRGLQAHLEGPLDWDEAAGAPYYTDKPAWDGYAALLLWAAYAEHPDLPRPHGATQEWEADPAYRASNVEGYHSRYGHLLYGCELWLPCEFDFTFRTEDVPGNEVQVGSSIALLAQLQDLNAATWNADAATLQEWRRASPPRSDSTLEDCARFAFAVFLELAEGSVTHSLPMKLDY